jgi:hypothetical protein
MSVAPRTVFMTYLGGGRANISLAVRYTQMLYRCGAAGSVDTHWVWMRDLNGICGSFSTHYLVTLTSRRVGRRKRVAGRFDLTEPAG